MVVPFHIAETPTTPPDTAALNAVLTKAVVAMLVSLSPAAGVGAGVGAVGFPANAGESIGAEPATIR